MSFAFQCLFCASVPRVTVVCRLLSCCMFLLVFFCCCVLGGTFVTCMFVLNWCYWIEECVLFSSLLFTALLRTNLHCVEQLAFNDQPHYNDLFGSPTTVYLLTRLIYWTKLQVLLYISANLLIQQLYRRPSLVLCIFSELH